MRHFLLSFFLFLITCFTGHVSAQITYWAQKAGGPNADEGKDISIDAGGNTYTTGFFSGTCHFGVYGNQPILTASGVTDVFLSKTDPTGQIVWVISAGGSGPAKGMAIKTDATGNSYITGYFTGTATFGSTVLTANASSQDIFVAKYDNAGILQWARRAGGFGGDEGYGINLDNAGNVLVTGEFIETADFGSMNITSMVNPITLLSSIDAFTAKYDNNGNILWVKKGSAPFTDRGIDVAADPSGNIYVTGQFSDTITFDVVHFNNMFNAIFLIKYDANGNEVWFRRIAGGLQNIAYGITVDQLGHIYLTGDFLNSLIFFGTPNYTLTNTYSDCIFVARYDSNGSLAWATSNGSSSEISSRNITIDDSLNTYITGYFKCRLNEYADVYGQGLFNSVGSRDVFVSKFNANGVRQWSYQCGGQQDDLGMGICINAQHSAIFAGSFAYQLNFPLPSNLNVALSSMTLWNFPGPNYCNDANYERYLRFSSLGVTDIFWGKIIDPSRSLYDYYSRTGTGCVFPYEGVCINFGSFVCPDTAVACNVAFLTANTFTGATGPTYTWHWSNGSNAQNTSVFTTGYYSVTQISADGCFVSTDSIYVVIHPNPAEPPISDSRGINNHATNTQPIHFCLPGSVILTGFMPPGTVSCTWTGGSIVTPVNNDSVTVSVSGNYIFTVTDSNGCVSWNNVQVFAQAPLPPVDLHIALMDDPDHNDTITTCDPGFGIYIYDAFTDPTGSNYCGIDSVINIWTVTPNVPNSPYCLLTNASEWFNISTSGAYDVMDTLIRITICDTDTFVLSIHVYINLLVANPSVLTLTPTYLMTCPGDTVVIHASGGTTYTWSGPGIYGPNNLDSVVVTMSGTYTCSTPDTGVCSAGPITATSIITDPTANPPPIAMNPSSGLICPGDSVLIFTSGGGHYAWFGPLGPMGGDTSAIYTDIAGFYFCQVTEPLCNLALLTQTVEVRQYATPYLFASPSSVICPGGSVTINVATNPGSTIQWLPPLSGNGLTQVVSTPGTYSCMITSCGIITTDSVIVTVSSLAALITYSGSPNICAGDSIILHGNSNVTNYSWAPGGQNTQDIVVNQSGTYILTTTDINGCIVVSLPVVVTVNPIPVVTGLIYNNPACEGGNLNLGVNAVASANYFWTGPNGFSSNLQSPIITNISLINAGVYYVYITANGCNSPTDSITVVIAPMLVAPIVTNNSPVCEGDSINLISNPISGAIYNWSGPSGFSSSTQNPTLFPSLVSNAGVYTLTYSISGCPSHFSATTVTVTPLPGPANPTSDSPLCDGDTLHLHSDLISGANYLWSGPGGFSSFSVNPVIAPAGVPNSGIYTLRLFQNGCYSVIDSITVNVYANPVVDLGSDTVVCPGIPITLNPGAGANYLWQNQSNSSTFAVWTPGIYSVVVTNANGCRASDDITITWGDCQLTAPNVITPNGDGFNDGFRIYNEDLQCFEIHIYDRWGLLMYISNDPNFVWDGIVMKTGGKAPDGTYYWILHWCPIPDKYDSITGFFELIRNE